MPTVRNCVICCRWANWDREFPGFEHVTEGSDVVDGMYRVMCVKE